LRDAAHASATNDSPLKYRLVRVQSGPFWKTTMMVIGATRSDVVAPNGQFQTIPPTVSRIEDDGDGSEPRFYDLQGGLLRQPAKRDRQKMGTPESVFASTDALAVSRPAAAQSQRPADGGRDWVDALMPSLEKKGVRRAALQNRFGSAVGKVRGLDRYIETTADQTLEVLADEDLSVPVEINLLRGGVLESHATFVYEAGPRGTMVRRRAHVEHAMPDGPERKNARMVLDVELANVTLEDRR
jgi:hypothetical protein